MKSFWEDKLLLLILVLAFVLRFWGIWWGFPLFLHLDEQTVLSPAVTMTLTGDLNPHYFRYPSLYIYFIYLIIKFCENFFSIDFTKNTATFYFICRLSTAILSTFTVYLVYRISRDFFSRRIALLSSLVFSVLFLSVYTSHFITTDTLALVFLLLSLFYSSKIYFLGKPRYYSLAGLCAGFLFGTKYNFLAIIPALAAHFLRKDGRKYSYLAYSFLAGSLGFLLTNPFFILDFKNYLPGIISQIKLLKGEEVVSISNQNGIPSWIWYFKYWLFSGMGLTLSFSTAIGAVWCIFKRRIWRKELLILFLLPPAYLIILFISHTRVDRYSLPLMPFFAILSAIFLSNAIDFIKEKVKAVKTRNILSVALMIIFICPSLVRAAAFDFLIGKKDTRLQAGEWISQNISPDQLIFTDGAAGPAGGYLQRKGFTNIIENFPLETDAIFRYAGDLVLIASWNYRESQNYRNLEKYVGIYRNYNLIKEKGKLIREFSFPLFKNEYFGPADLEHSSTVNAYHNPIVQLYEIPEISENNLTVREYSVRDVINASLVESVGDKDAAGGKSLLIRPNGVLVMMFSNVVAKGKYKVIFRLKSEERAMAKKIVATMEIISSSESVLAQKTLIGSGLTVSNKYFDFEMPLILGQGKILLTRISNNGDGKLWVESVKAISIYDER